MPCRYHATGGHAASWPARRVLRRAVGSAALRAARLASPTSLVLLRRRPPRSLTAARRSPVRARRGDTTERAPSSSGGCAAPLAGRGCGRRVLRRDRRRGRRGAGRRVGRRRACVGQPGRTGVSSSDDAGELDIQPPRHVFRLVSRLAAGVRAFDCHQPICARLLRRESWRCGFGAGRRRGGRRRACGGTALAPLRGCDCSTQSSAGPSGKHRGAGAEATEACETPRRCHHVCTILRCERQSCGKALSSCLQLCIIF